MIKDKKITLIIPCRNEANALTKLLPKVPVFVDEIIVVDNLSKDKTAEVARKLGATVIKEKRVDSLGIGYGYSHQKGMQQATGDILVTMDGDGTYPLMQIKEVVEYLLKNNCDFVTCSRFPLSDKQVISNFRKLGVWILNTAVSLLYLKRVDDVLSGMWVLNKGCIEKLKVVEGGWDLSPEIKLNALVNPEISFSQYHIHHYRREDDKSKQQLWVTGTKHLLYIIKRWTLSDNFVVGSINKLKTIRTKKRLSFDI